MNTSRIVLGLTFLLFMGLGCGVPIAHALPATDVAPVSLTIDEWSSVTVHPPTPPSTHNIVMTTVPASWFGTSLPSIGCVLIDVVSNHQVKLRAPTSTVLTGSPGSYTVSADIAFSGGGLPTGFNPLDPGYQFIIYDAGSYVGTTVLCARISGHAWTVADLAGTYTGSILLELIPVP